MVFITASKNKKKIAELNRILIPLGIEAKTENELGVAIPEVEENGVTFADNAKLKAVSAMKATGLPAVADDSGLCVDALSGAPGVYSARYGGENTNDEINNKKLLSELSDIPQQKRTARFVSAVCVAFPNGDFFEANGSVEGVIGFAPSGEGGFGYDPLFFVGDKSFAELTPDEKDAISHRGKALRALQVKLEEYIKNA